MSLRQDFDPIPEDTEMADDRWGDGDVNHLFCRTCGIYPYHGDDSFGYRVNLGCVDEIDVLSLAITVIDGRAM